MKLKKRIAILAIVAVSGSILGMIPSHAALANSKAEGTSQIHPTPSPGPSPTPPESGSKVDLHIPAFIGPVVQSIEIGFINRGVGIPGFLDAPRSVISNVGGYGQIVPTIVVAARNNLPIILGIIRGFTLFGAANG